MSRKIYLLKYPAQPRQRSHFGIWVPSGEGHSTGKIIQVLGTPFTGFNLEFQRSYDLNKALPIPVVIELGAVQPESVVGNNYSRRSPDKTPLDKLETLATFVTPPRPSKNPLIVDGVSLNRPSLISFGGSI
jgi:hypothetical protein